ncbi:MAG: ATP-binding protein [Acidimicrobiales bacterium]
MATTGEGRSESAAGMGMRSGTATVLFTDLVGSTELRSRLGDDRADQVRREHDALLADALITHEGTQVKWMGDGLMATFGAAADAIACALAMQRAIHRFNRQAPEPLGLRVGLSAGDVAWEEGDCFGAPVVEAKRLCDAAAGGQVLVTEVVRLLAGSRGNHQLNSLGRLDLKGLAEPVEAYEAVWEPAEDNGLALPAAVAEGPTDTAFVGRADERHRLETAWKRARNGQRSVLLLGGEPGIGKTRLAVEVARAAHAEGAAVLFGRCDEENLVPYQPFVEALRGYVLAADIDSLRSVATARAEELSRLVPELSERLGGPEARDDQPIPGNAPDQDRYRLFEAVAGLVRDLSSTTPVLLVLDDLHWADQPTLLLLRHLIRSPGPAALLVVGTYRETDLSRTHPLAEALADLRREPSVERLSLAGLSDDDVAAFLEATIQHELGRRGRALVEVLQRETEGNPFFIGSILLHLVETNRVYRRDGVWTFDVDVEQLGIPEGVREVIGRRLSRLSEGCNRVLSQAAILGRAFDFDVLARVAGDDEGESDPLAAVEEALAAQILVETRERGRAGYAFTHALVRQTLEEELSLPRLQRLHLRAAGAIRASRQEPTDAEVAALAQHYRAAGAAADPAEAVEWSLRAAALASSVFAWEDAMGHLRAAVETLEDLGGESATADRARLLEQLGDLSFVTGLDYARGIADLERALKLHEQRGDERRGAQVHSRLGRGLSSFPDTTLDIEAALGHYRAAERVLAKGQESASLVYLLAGIAQAAQFAYQSAEGLEASGRALEIADRLGDQALWATAALQRGWHLAARGHPTEGLALMERAWEVGDRLNHGFICFHATTNRAGWSLWMGDPEEAVGWLERELAQPRTALSPKPTEWLYGNLLQAELTRGRLRELDEARAAQPVRDELDVQYVGAQADFYRGDWTRADATFGAAAEQNYRSGNVWWGSICIWHQARARRMLADPAAAEALLRRYVTSVGGRSLVPESMGRGQLARVLAEVGRTGEARDEAAEARRIVESGEDWRALPARVSHAEACVAAADRRWDEMDAHFATAVEGLAHYGLVWEHAEALHDWGRALIEAGKPTGAIERLDASLQIYQRHGAGRPWLEGVAADRVRAAGA